MKENKNKVRNLLLLEKESMKKNKTEGNNKKSKKQNTKKLKTYVTKKRYKKSNKAV